MSVPNLKAFYQGVCENIAFAIRGQTPEKHKAFTAAVLRNGQNYEHFCQKP